MKLPTKIGVTYVGIAVAAIILVSILTTWQLRQYLDKRVTNVLRSEVDLLAHEFEKGDLRIDTTGATDTELENVAGILNLRLTLVAKDGRVIYDSQVRRDSLGRLENHGNRPEIVKAREAVTGIDRRHSASVEDDFVYIAKHVTDPGLGALDSGYVRAALRLEEIRTINNQLLVIIWVVGLFTVLVVGFVSVQLSKRITRPVLAIAETANAIKSGDLQQRIPVRGKDEIADLSRAINEMAAKLSDDIGQLRKLERVRSEFLGNVSHELRTPIFSIQGFLETLLDGAIDDPGVNREFLEKAHRHAERLNTLLNDLIEISRIESGDMKMSFRYFDLRDFLSQVVEELSGAAAKKDITLTFDAPVGEFPKVYGDRDRLRQVMVNLIDNAIKYTDPRGHVTVGVRIDKGQCFVSVKDSGVGIAPEHLDRIFERFYRVDRDRSREVGGTGLGLAIVKHIVEAHGGKIDVQSTVGAGSTFTFTLKV